MQFRSPPPLPSIFLMDGYLTKTRGGKKGQIRPMTRFCVLFQRHEVTTGHLGSAVRDYFRIADHPSGISKLGKNGLQVGDADVFGQDFAEDQTKIGGQRKVAPFVELMIVQAGPTAINFAAHHKYAVGASVVGALNGP